VTVAVVVPFALTPAFLPLFFELVAALLGLTAALTVSADGLVQPFFRLMDLSFAFVVPIVALGLHGNYSTQQQECA
jgi:hypothetical protein